MDRPQTAHRLDARGGSRKSRASEVIGLTRNFVDMKSQTEKARKLIDMGFKAEDEGHLSKALRFYQQAAKINPSSPLPTFSIATVLFEQGKWSDAIKTACQVIKHWPDGPHLYLTYSLIGECHVELNQPLRAERAFRQSLAIKPGPEAWVFLSHLLGRLGRRDESKEGLRNALKLDPNYDEAH